jgi:hypothetical protein
MPTTMITTQNAPAMDLAPERTRAVEPTPGTRRPARSIEDRTERHRA